MIKRIILIFIVFQAMNLSAFSQHLMIPYNLNFENGAPLYDPPQWKGNSKAIERGYIFVTSDSLSSKGKKSLMIASLDEKDTSYKAIVRQNIYAKPYLGKKYSFSADIRFAPDNDASFGIIYLNVRDINDNIVASYLSPDKLIIKDQWQNYSLDVDIPTDAFTISYGFVLKGSGVMFVDNVLFQNSQDYSKFFSPSLMLSKTQLNNISSWAQIFGLIKYFYPSHFHDKINWERTLIEGLHICESSLDDNDFSKNISDFISSFCPLHSLNKTGSPTFVLPEMKPGLHPYTWLHSGLPADYPTTISNSKLINLGESQRSVAGIAIMNKSIDIARAAGGKYILTVNANIEKEDLFAFGNLMLRFEDVSGKLVGSGSLSEPFISSETHSFYSIEAEVPSNAVYLKLAQNLYGDGKLYINDITLQFKDSKGNLSKISVEEFNIKGSKFNLNDYWNILPASSSAGYSYSLAVNPSTKENSILLESTTLRKLKLPATNHISSVLLPNGYYFIMPTVLFLDSLSNANINPNIDFTKSGKPADFDISFKDRHSRFAVAIELWNLLYHFYPNVDTSISINLLSNIIREISLKDDEISFEEQINRLILPLKDNNASLSQAADGSNYSISAILKFIDNSLYVTNALKDSELQIGDKIIEIDGINTHKYLNNIEKNISASNDMWKKITAIAKIRNGSYNSTIKFKVERDGKSFVAEMKRIFAGGEVVETRPNRLEMLNDTIIYCDMTRTTDTEIKDNLLHFENSSAIIFDMRGESLVSEYILGLIASDSIKSLPYILEMNLLPSKQLLNKVDLAAKIKIIEKLQSKKIVFLQDERSTGLSETILSLVKENNIAKTIGRSSAGGAGEVAAVRIAGNYFLTCSALAVHSLNGEIIAGKSIQPDIIVEHSLMQYQENYDATLLKALEYLNLKN